MLEDSQQLAQVVLGLAQLSCFQFASLQPECRLTGTPTTRAKKKREERGKNANISDPFTVLPVNSLKGKRLQRPHSCQYLFFSLMYRVVSYLLGKIIYLPFLEMEEQI